MWRRSKRLLSVGMCTVLLLSMGTMFLPNTSALEWTQDDDADFNDPNAIFSDTELIGTGPGANIQIVKNWANWMNMSPEASPIAMEGPAVAFDSKGGVLVLFGGYHSGEGLWGFLNDTWEYDYTLNNWTLIDTPTRPPHRRYAGMAYDGDQEVMVLYGGVGTEGRLMDTWEYDVNSNTWTNTTGLKAPGPMLNNPMAYDSKFYRVIMVGRDVGTGEFQTWQYRADMNTWLEREPASSPPTRGSHAFAFDEQIGKTVLFGGMMGLTEYDDTWEYDYGSNNWILSSATGPPPRGGHAMAYRSSDNGVIMFGGISGGSYIDDTWKYHYVSGTPTWESLTPNRWPSARVSYGMAYDGKNDYVLLFGGYNGDFLGDTWSLGLGYATQGWYTSGIFDSGDHNSQLVRLYWNYTPVNQPLDTDLAIQLAVSPDPDPDPVNWTFIGPAPACNPWGYYNETSPSEIECDMKERYFRYRVRFISWTQTYSPVFDDITIVYGIPPSPPYIVSTDPANGEFNVPLDKMITVVFSEEMDIGTVNVTITPEIPLTKSWSPDHMTLSLTHLQLFVECTVYQVGITGKDMDGFDLIQNPVNSDVVNPWWFYTVCEPPTILWTDPSNGETGVLLDYPITIKFSETMNTTTVEWKIIPDPEGWQPDDWTELDSRLTLYHSNPFKECTEYTFNVTQAKDMSGLDLDAPFMNPFSFTTICYSPYIVDEMPDYEMSNVPLNMPIYVNFSEPMDTGTVNWTITPGITLSDSWYDGNKYLILTHSIDFQQCKKYEITIEGKDMDGYPLIQNPDPNIPNPWWFATVCVNPYITSTDPADGQENVSLDATIIIGFSEPMNTGTVKWTIDPDQGLGWNETWLFSQALYLSHSSLFTSCTYYTVTVTEGQDPDGYPLVAGPVPNPWTFSTPFTNPCIMLTDPADGDTDVPLNKPINVTFSEPIDPDSLQFAIQPNITLTPSWDASFEKLTLSHTDSFAALQVHWVTIIQARDMDGNDLAAGPIPNPWSFTTEVGPGPKITYTDPPHLKDNVPVYKNITVEFSVAMDTGSVWWNYLPTFPVIDFSPSWSNGSTTLLLEHTVPFREGEQYTIQIHGNDTLGQPLVPNPDVPNPWDFFVTTNPPYIMSTDPADNEADVPVNAGIEIDFSESMDTATVNWIIVPDPGAVWTWTWKNDNKTLNLTHSIDFDICTLYNFTVTQGKDVDGIDLVPGPVPNPWEFITICINPYIVSTDPEDGQTGVPFNYSITVVFSEPIDKNSLNWTINPDPGGWSEVWLDPETLVLEHTEEFKECWEHVVEIVTADDMDGNPLSPGPDGVPNPWAFTTACIPPQVIFTSPSDGDMNVGLSDPIIVIFSEPMNTVSVVWDTSPVVAPPWDQTWTGENTTLTLTHTVDFERCTWYTFTIYDAMDRAGLSLVPLPFEISFKTFCPNPYIVETYPVHLQTGVGLYEEIVVTFNEEMDITTVNWTITPDPDPGGWTESWNPAHTILTLNHSKPYQQSTVYTVEVTEGKDMDGYDLVDGLVPNPWRFQTGTVPSPKIVWTDPYDTETNVDLDKEIVVRFSKEMDPGSLSWSIVPVILLEATWNASHTEVTLSHVDEFTPNTTYMILISCRDLFGNPLIPGPVQNPWTFTTGWEAALSRPRGLEVLREPPNVRLVWNPVTVATSYHVYHSMDRFQPFPWADMFDTTNTFYVFPGHLTDGLTHYYIVRAYNSSTGTESGNSTMGVKIQKDFTYNPLTTNIYWMSLPYNSIYKTASDITDELTKDNIRVVGKWDRITQRTQLYYYLRGKWRGNDFNIDSGDGIYVSTISTFSWYITGTDRSVILSFTYGTTMIKTNIHWISIPYTGTYSLASRIVTDIEGGIGPGNNTKIIEVGKWDPSKQDVVKYIHTPAGWSGDFNILPGDGIYLKVVTNFDWEPKLITPEVP